MKNKTSAEKLEEIIKGLDYTVNVKPTGIMIHPCGCTIEELHSHLVIGQECECEKGQVKNTLS